MLNKTVFYLFLILVVSTMGCGNGMTSVRGKVTFSDGSPVTRGTVVFVGDPYSASGDIQSDGSYVLGSKAKNDGIRPGNYKVAVQKNWDDESGADGAPPPDTFDVAPKFRSAESSGVTCDLEAGKSKVFDFSVEKK